MSDSPPRNDFRPIVFVKGECPNRHDIYVATVKGPHGMPANVARAHVAAALRLAVSLLGPEPTIGGKSVWMCAKRKLPKGFCECAEDKYDVLDVADAAGILAPDAVVALMGKQVGATE